MLFAEENKIFDSGGNDYDDVRQNKKFFLSRLRNFLYAF